MGTSLLDAATLAGVEITAPCGGTGSCGQCRARVVSGKLRALNRSGLTREEREQGWVLACASRIAEDVAVEAGWMPEEGARIVAGDGSAGAPGQPAEPLVRRAFLEVEHPSLDNSFDDLSRIERALRCDGIRPALTCSLDVLRGVASALRERDHRVTATLLERAPGDIELLRIEPGDTTGASHGLAIDVGTTTCAVQLVDLSRNRLRGTGTDYNGQVARGLDIISRINYAKSPERLEEMRRLAVDTLNGIIDGLCAEHGVSPDDIDSVAVAGNTTMVHLLLGIEPEHIRLEPYTPTVNRPPLVRGKELGLRLNPRGVAHFAPGVGSYVGGDITAGLLVTALATDDEAVRLFLDIGTNGEVVVGNGEWLMACAASAGPAFEGGGVGCGMRASAGAVERVQVDPSTGRAEVGVIGGGKARGICGSGMIDLLSELWGAGLLDSSGKLDPSRGEWVRSIPGRRCLAYVVVPAEESATGADIVIDETDILHLLRTKAAVYSACALMLRSVGLDFDAVEEVYVAGGFGRYLDLEKSIRIGLLPDLPLERFTYLGNSSLAGAHALLTRADARRRATELADRITYLELNVDPAYMDEYTAALFLPHTDRTRFPSVQLNGI